MAGDQASSSAGPTDYSAKATDPPLLAQNSETKSFTTSRFTYPDVRVFYRRHPQADQLPVTPAPLPLLVFIHGLGGSVAQFHPLLTSLVNVSSCLAVDLPGCGASEFVETKWEAYSTEALVELLELVIEEYRVKDPERSVVLVGHSMGTALAARLASKDLPHSNDLHTRVTGLVAICPISGPPPEEKVKLFKKLLWIPGWLFDLWRAWDKRGGPESASVLRFVGKDADAESKLLQDRFNNQSRTPVWRRMAWGTLPTFKNGTPKGGIPGLDVWKNLDLPVFLVAGENDNVTPPTELEKLVKVLRSGEAPPSDEASENRQPVVDAAAPVNASSNPTDHVRKRIEDIQHGDFTKDKRLANREDPHDDPSTPQEQPLESTPSQPPHPPKVVKSIILPAPATHALLYTPATVRVLAGLVSDFLACHITGRLSLGWQLQYLSREGKWDVKNLEKWKNVAPVSGPMPLKSPVFRALKTLREADETHSPAEFSRQWAETVKDVVDISHDQPVYDPRGLERAGIRYHKFPTVSKVPPTEVEVDAFIALVDKLRTEQTARGEGTSVVGVHCHYGFNRTGYFVVCYLVERCGMSVADAIETFAAARPNGIRHSHFLDRLFVRYSGLKGEEGKNGGPA